MKGKGSKRPSLYAAAIVIAGFAFFLSQNYFQLMLIQGESMEPSYHNLQLVLLDKRGGAYKAGDVIAFRCEGLDAVLVKRIAAVPGDVAACRDGELYVNDEPYFDCPWSASGAAELGGELGGGSYFVVGDNFELSRDSRYSEVGAVRKEDIIGLVLPQISYGG